MVVNGEFMQKLKKTGLAKSFRKKPTETEYKLWGYLRANQLGGFKFRRQAPIGNYIVDFVCFSKKVVVELDGESHSLKQDDDKKRERWLENQGFTILRFWNMDVMNDIDGVLNLIWKVCKDCD